MVDRPLPEFVVRVLLLATLIGCAGEDGTSPTNPDTGAVTTVDAGEHPGFTVDVVPQAVWQEMYLVITEFETSQGISTSPESTWEQVDSVAGRLKRSLEAFGVTPDADGNLTVPQQFRDELIKPSREMFDADPRAFLESLGTDLPDWAEWLLEVHQQDSLSSERLNVLFWGVMSKLLGDLA